MTLLVLLMLFIGGIIGGLYASTVGGGALLSFPLLVLTGMPTLNVIATQRFAAVILEFASAARFHKDKHINIKVAAVLGLIAVFGSVIGANLVINISEKALNIIVAIAFLGVFLILFNKNKLGIKEKEITHKNLVLTAIATFFLSIYGGFFGAGFGFFIIVILVLLGFTFIKSAAIGRVVGFCMSLTGAIIFAQHHLINYTYGLSLGAGFAIGSWIGIGIALKKGDSYIKSLMVIILILSMLKLLSGIFGIKII